MFARNYVRRCGSVRVFRVAVVTWFVAMLTPASPIFSHHDPSTRVTELSQRIDHDPENAILHLERGELHRTAGQWPAAEADFRRAIELELELDCVDDALARIAHIEHTATRKEPWAARRGAILEEQGRTNEALVAYDDALNAIAALPESRRRSEVAAVTTLVFLSLAFSSAPAETTLIESGASMRYIDNDSDPGIALTWTAESAPDRSQRRERTLPHAEFRTIGSLIRLAYACGKRRRVPIILCTIERRPS